jgi:predicted phosphodiesterase
VAPRKIPLPEKKELLRQAKGCVSSAELGRRLGLQPGTLRKRLRDEGWTSEVDAVIAEAKRHRPTPALDEAGLHENADGSTAIVSDPRNQPPAPWKPDELLRAHGLDVAEWEIVRTRSNRWGDPAEPMHQLRVDAIPRRELIVIPDPSDWTPPPKPTRRALGQDEPRKAVVCGDHHCPSHEKGLHTAFLQWLADERPDEGVILGDIVDLPTVSRHRRSKGVEPATVNDCLAAAFGVLMDYRHASPNTVWTLLPGNHDDRLDHYQIDQAPAAYEIRAAQDDVPALSLRRLLHLDDLGIDLVDGDFNRAKYLLGRKLSLRHGYLAGKGAADKMLAKLSRSVVQGHTHRLRLIYKTEHDEQDEEDPTITRLGAEAGCMAEIAAGLDYADEPDWQQGFLVAHLWADHDFTLEPAVYVPGRLLAPGGRRYVVA